MKKIEVSIVMPTYNRGYIISSAIESVIAQSYSEWELIIVDDGSTDDTEKVVSRYITDERIMYYKMNENHGANYCRNYGIKQAKGEYLAFIDSDVIWKSNKLYRQMSCLKENISCDLVFCKTMLIREDRTIEFPKRDEHPFLEPNSLKYGNFIDTNTVLIKKEVVLGVGGFDEKLPRLQEWELFIRIILIENHSFYFMDEHLCDNYIQKDSISEDDKKYLIAMNYIINKHSGIFLSTDLKGFITRNISEDMDNFITTNGKAYIYGAGYYGNFLKEFINAEYGITTSFVVTNSTDNDVAVCIKQLDKNTPIIIGVNKNLSNEIRKTLVDNGYTNWIDGYQWEY